MLIQLDHITIPQHAMKNHFKVILSDRSIQEFTKITPSYPFRSIYLRVHTKITPYDTHQPTLMSPRYFNVTTSIRELIIWYASNNFRFIILNPTQRTSKSAPRFLPEKQGRKRASTPMHRITQCHLGNPRVECQNIHQVNQYDTPL